MDRTVRAFAWLFVLVSLAGADIQLPWWGVFRDTTIDEIDGVARKTIVSRTEVTINSPEHTNEVNWIFQPQDHVWIKPHFYFNEYAQKIVHGDLVVGTKLGSRLEIEPFVSPEKVTSWSTYAESVSTNDTVAVVQKPVLLYKDHFSGGLGARFKVLPYVRLYGNGRRIYYYRYYEYEKGYHNPGWGGTAAGRVILPWPATDSIRVSGLVKREDQERGGRFYSDVRFLSKHVFQGSQDAIAVAARQSGGSIRDEVFGLDDEISNRSLAALYTKRIGKSSALNFYGIRTWEYDRPLHTAVYDLVGHASSQGPRYSLGGLIGFGGKHEVNANDNAASYTQMHFWLEGEIEYAPTPRSRIGWHGYGSRRATDLDLSDSTSDDNDKISVQHRAWMLYLPAPACSTGLEARYRESIDQYLKARWSINNNVRRDFVLVPILAWQVGDRFHGKQEFELAADYTQYVFVPDTLAMGRHLRSTSTGLLELSAKNALLGTCKLWHSDKGEIVDNLRYYGIGTKTWKFELHLGWRRKVFETLTVTPGIGRADNRVKKFDGRYYVYTRDPNLTYHRWIYTLQLKRIAQARPLLWIDLSYEDQSNGEQYWNVHALVRQTF